MGNRVFVYMEGLDKIPDMLFERLSKADKDIENLKKEIAELDKMWEGPAHDTFTKDLKSSVEDMEDIFKRYRKLTDFERAAYNTYSKANQNCADKIATLK